LFLLYLSANISHPLKKFVFAALSFFLFFFQPAAQDSCSLRISLLTCAPGAELYSTFGHTAIRVRDNAAGTDEVFNYGTFEFAPDFYYKFVKGKLLYALSVEEFRDFLFQYQAESRSIVEQELNVTCGQKEQLFAALRTNALPENRFYRYDFLFDNCTTRAGDIIVKNSGGTAQFRSLFGGGQPTFRELIYVYLNKAHQDWSKFGIDLLLGAKLDRQATNKEAMFLPDNLMMAMDTATVNGLPLVGEEQPVLVMPLVATESYLITPFVLFTMLLAAGVILSFVNSKSNFRVTQVFDFLFFFILGLTGILLLFMWFGTDHALCANNYNLLWALPTHTAAAFFVHKKERWVTLYFRAVFFISLLLLAGWAFLPQHLNTALLPLVFLLVLRAWMLSKNKNAN
jgi:hypothetical protein